MTQKIPASGSGSLRHLSLTSSLTKSDVDKSMYVKTVQGNPS